MTSVTLHHPPTLGAAFRAHLRTLFISLRWERRYLVISYVLLTLLAVRVVYKWNEMQAPQHTASSQSTEATQRLGDSVVVVTRNVVSMRGKTFVRALLSNVNVWPFFCIVILFPLAIILAFGIWRAEPISNRTYHLAMPVSRGIHALTKIAAGGLWLFIAAVVTIAFIVALGFGIGYAMHLSPIYGVPSFPTAVMLSNFAAAITASMILYLLVSALTVSVVGPSYWLIGISIVWGWAPSILAKVQWPQIADGMRQLWTARFGLGTALRGPVKSDLVHSMIFDLSGWWIATAMWIAVGLTLLIIAAYGRRT